MVNYIVKVFFTQYEVMDVVKQFILEDVHNDKEAIDKCEEYARLYETELNNNYYNDLPDTIVTVKLEKYDSDYMFPFTIGIAEIRKAGEYRLWNTCCEWTY